MYFVLLLHALTRIGHQGDFPEWSLFFSCIFWVWYHMYKKIIAFCEVEFGDSELCSLQRTQTVTEKGGKVCGVGENVRNGVMVGWPSLGCFSVCASLDREFLPCLQLDGNRHRRMAGIFLGTNTGEADWDFLQFRKGGTELSPLPPPSLLKNPWRRVSSWEPILSWVILPHLVRPVFRHEIIVGKGVVRLCLPWDLWKIVFHWHTVGASPPSLWIPTWVFSLLPNLFLNVFCCQYPSLTR